MYAPTIHKEKEYAACVQAERDCRRSWPGCNLATCAYEVQSDSEVAVGCADLAGETREAVDGPDTITISMCMVHVCNKTAQIKDVVSRT